MVSGDKCVLCGLRCLELESLVLCREGRNLIRSQEVKDSAGVVLRASYNIARISLVSILYISDCRTSVTTTFCDLARKSVETCLGVVTETTQSIVYTVETIGYSIVECVGAICKSVSLLVEFGNESLLVNCGSNICLCCTRRSTMTAAKTTETATKAVAVVTPTEKKENYDPIMLS